jgi:hypothetical protein
VIATACAVLAPLSELAVCVTAVQAVGVGAVLVAGVVIALAACHDRGRGTAAEGPTRRLETR